jgi:hypothetical protein
MSQTCDLVAWSLFTKASLVKNKYSLQISFELISEQ